jgi:hypothetical protein
MSTDLPRQALREGSETDRRLAARTIREVAAEQPARLHGSLTQVADALGDQQEPVRRDVANALFEVGVAEPTAVAPVAEALVDALGDAVTAVRACVSRPLAELAAEHPRRLRTVVPSLVTPLSDVKSVRTNVAWALSSLAPLYPELLEPHADELTRALLDDHYPVQVSTLRTLLPLERAYPGLCDVVSDRLRDLLTAEVAGVRQAACRVAAATDQSWADEALRDRARADSHPLVRQCARACRRAAATDGDPTVPASVFEAATPGTWAAVGVDGDDSRFLVGRTTGVVRDTAVTDVATMASHGVRREDFETRQEWFAAPRVPPSGDRLAVHLHNPAADYGVTLRRSADGVDATRVDGNGCRDYHAVDAFALEPDRARLVAATPGDRLAFELEGATHDVCVTSAGPRDGRYRVTGENRHRGYRITFRPFESEPMMAVFEAGRAFRARNVSLTAGE